MFGLSTREVLYKAILNASRNHLTLYLSLYKEIESDLLALDPDDFTNASVILQPVHQAYYDAVSNSVFNTYQVASPRIFTRITMCLMSPALCGYRFDLDRGIPASSLYAICYWAVKNKIAPKEECNKILKLQADLIDSALEEYLENKRR